MSFNSRWKPLIERTDTQTATRVVGVGASVLSKEENPFTKQIAELLGLPYVEYSSVGCSNETIFRYITHANTQYTNAIIIPVFTYLTRVELVDRGIGYVPQLGKVNSANIKERKKQSEMYFGYVYDEQQEVLRFWNRLYDVQFATQCRSNTLIGTWDTSTPYHQHIDMLLNKEGMDNMFNFKDYCLTDNMLWDYPLEPLREGKLYMTTQAHTKLAQLITKGTTDV